MRPIASIIKKILLCCVSCIIVLHFVSKRMFVSVLWATEIGSYELTAKVCFVWWLIQSFATMLRFMDAQYNWSVGKRVVLVRHIVIKPEQSVCNFVQCIHEWNDTVCTYIVYMQLIKCKFMLSCCILVYVKFFIDALW